jgi:hypothetical protein
MGPRLVKLDAQVFTRFPARRLQLNVFSHLKSQDTRLTTTSYLNPT